MPQSETHTAPSNKPTDLELMTGVIERDEQAFETLMFRHEDRVYSLAARILGRNADAQDVAQEVFINLWENPHAWKPSALFTTWLYRVTSNHALNRLRSIKLKRFVSLGGSGGDVDVNVEQIETSSTESPDEGLINSERQARLERALQRINPRQRAALHLRYREDLPVKEVATVLNVSVKSAESLIFRGKRRLKELLH